MSTRSVEQCRWIAIVGAAVCLPLVAAADVTLEQSVRMDGPSMMGLLDMGGTVKTSISGNRARTESDLSMKSRLVGLFAGGRTAEIIELDQEKFYALDLKKKTYTEMTLAEQRQAIDDAVKAMRDAQDPQQRSAAGVNSTDCDWSEPSARVEQPGDTETIAGYRAGRTIVTASQSCRDPRTGSVCDFSIVLDQWVVDDLAAGREADQFWRRYAEKLGMGVSGSPGFSQRLEGMFSSYPGIWKEIAREMQNTSGYPVRTTVMLALGGPQCEANQQAHTAGNSSAEGPAAERAPGMNESIGGAVGSAVGGDDGISGVVGRSLGGLLGKRRDEAARNKQDQQAAVASSSSPVKLPSGSVSLMSITSELVSVSSDSVPASAFVVPEKFRKVQRPVRAPKA